MTDETKKRIIDILNNTFDAIDKCYGVNDEMKGSTNYGEAETRLLFPSYYQYCESDKVEKKETRISEQELRFLFIEQFNKYCNSNKWDVYYSVETPTQWKYKFSGEEKPPTPHRVDFNKAEDGGQSAMIDVCIHDNAGKRICLIEFKFGNPEKFCFEKDLVKLTEEKGLRFFVHLLKSQQKDTRPSVWGKIKDITTDNEAVSVSFTSINYICHTLPKKKGQSGKTEYISGNNDEFNGLSWNRTQLSDPATLRQITDYQEKIENKRKKNQ